MEYWKDAPDFEGRYEVSGTGLVRRTTTWRGFVAGRHCKSFLNMSGYPQVRLYHADLSSKSVTVHRLVARAFHGEPIPPRNCVNHKDGDRSNNHADNLEWVTTGENLLHSHRVNHRYCPRGVEHHKTTLADDDIREIRRIYRDGEMGQVLLARKFKVTQTTIWRIIHRMVWAHISD